MAKQISQFNPGDAIAYMADGGWNHVVGIILGKDEHGVSVWVTSLTFGAEDADGVFLPNDFPVTKWQSSIPEILKD
jgi:hypothetical protein